MPIEFRCSQCNRLLRTRDDTAGKQAKCPECGTVLTIPTPGEPPQTPPAPPGGPPTPPAAPPVAGPAPPEGGDHGSPFGTLEPPAAGGHSPFSPGATPADENPYASPHDYTVGGPAGAAPAVARGRIVPSRIEVGDVFGRAWAIYREQWTMCLGLVLVAWLISTGVNFVAGMIPIVGPIASALFSVWIYVGVAIGLLRIARGQETTIGDVFNGGPYFARIFFASLLYGLMLLAVFGILFVPGLTVVMLALRGGDEAMIVLTSVGVGLLCSIPTAVLALMYSQFYYLIIEQDAGILDSLRLSKEITSGNKLTLLAIWVLLGLVNLAGALACCVGLLFTTPFVALANVVVYLAMTGQPTAYGEPRGATLV